MRKEVVNEMKVDRRVSHLCDIKQFAKYGATATPAVLIEGKVVMAGRVSSEEEVKRVIGGK